MIPKDHVFPGFWANLTLAETYELQGINQRVKQWVMHCGECDKKRIPRDETQAVPDHLYFRQQVLRDKLFQPRKVLILEDHINSSTPASGETNSVSFVRVNFGVRA